MLEGVLAPDLTPGTNAPGGLACPPWWFLLDRLEPMRLLLAGAVDAADARWLRQRAPEVVAGPVAAAAGPFDLVVLGPDAARSLADADAEHLRALLGPTGQVVADAGAESLPASTTPGAGWHEQVVLASPARGRLVTAVPAADPVAGAWLARQPAAAPAEGRWRRRLPTSVRRLVPARPAGQRPARIWSRSATSTAVPAYLVEAAAEAGVDLAAHGWALWSRGDYPSQKAVLFLFAPGATEPELVVKLTKDARFNARLENEVVALHRLASLEPAVDRGPGLRFAGHAGGLAFAAEAMVAGVPFVQASGLHATCPVAADAAAGITDLGRATAHDIDPAVAAAPLGGLLARYVDLFGPTPGQRRFLEAQVQAVADASRLPAVLHHGDLGTWNVVVGPSGAATFLDWEAAEEPGPPLWDLFYFLRSFAVQASRRSRVRSRLRAATAHLVDVTPVTRAAAGWVATYRAAVGVPDDLVEPLFHTCWLHRAVKEAARLGPGGRGHYAELSALLADQHDRPGLRLLLTGGDRG